MLMLSREMPCFGSDPSQEVYLTVLVSSGWFNKIPQTRGLEQQKPVSHSPGTKVRVRKIQCLGSVCPSWGTDSTFSHLHTGERD